MVMVQRVMSLFKPFFFFEAFNLNLNASPHLFSYMKMRLRKVAYKNRIKKLSSSEVKCLQSVVMELYQILSKANTSMKASASSNYFYLHVFSFEM